MSDTGVIQVHDVTVQTRAVHRYGWKPDPFDARDKKFLAKVTRYPEKVDLRIGMPPVYDQGQLGSCTANGAAACFEFDLLKQKLSDYVPSRLFGYYNERVLDHDVSSDAGSTIRCAVKVLSKIGAPDEKLWPYIESKFADKPPANVYEDAKLHRCAVYQRVLHTQPSIKGALASGFPVVFGFNVFESFEGDAIASTGKMPMPAPGEQIIGGHCVVACGYNKTYLICRNSWGPDWGGPMKGYFTMPWKFLLTPNCSDFWVVQKVN